MSLVILKLMHTTKVRIFYSLLFLSILEICFWASPICDVQTGARDYFTRETSNFCKTDGQFHSFAVLGIDLSQVEHSAKLEAKASQYALRLDRLLDTQKQLSADTRTTSFDLLPVDRGILTGCGGESSDADGAAGNLVLA